MLAPLKEAGHKVLYMKVRRLRGCGWIGQSIRIIKKTDPDPLHPQHMAKHIVGLDLGAFLKRTTNVLLIRNPVDMLASWADRMGACACVCASIDLLSRTPPNNKCLWKTQRPLN